MSEREPKPMPGECEHCGSVHTDSHWELLTDEVGNDHTVKIYTCKTCGHRWGEEP